MLTWSWSVDINVRLGEINLELKPCKQLQVSKTAIRARILLVADVDRSVSDGQHAGSKPRRATNTKPPQAPP